VFISNPAVLGALLGGRRIVDPSVRERMAEVLKEVRAGRFAQELSAEETSGYARLEQARDQSRRSEVEQTYDKLRRLTD
jgi:ketol-acid reductoisomerase